jgi:hypothetical protein
VLIFSSIVAGACSIVPGLFAAPGRRLAFPPSDKGPRGWSAERRPFQSTPSGAGARIAGRAPLSAPSRHLQADAHVGDPAISSGPRFLNRHWRRPIQRAPRRALLVAPERGPGAARVQVCVTCPQGRTPLRHIDASRWRPRMSEAVRVYIPIGIKSRTHSSDLARLLAGNGQ